MTDTKPTILATHHVSKHYQRGPQLIKAVDEVNLEFRQSEFTAIVGSSGSGKSTLLNLLAGLDTPTDGEIQFQGEALSGYSRRRLAAYRGVEIGMVFQSFNLIQHRTALENVELALYFNGVPRTERGAQAKSILDQLGLAERMSHRPADLSGGEQQRVAIARALVKKPAVLFADEPTGNLDQENSRQIIGLLRDLSRSGLTVIMVTHDRELASNFASRIVRMHYGKIVDSSSDQGGTL